MTDPTQPEPHPTTPTTSPDPDPATVTPPVPLSVWLTGQQPSRVQRSGRYVPASVAHPGKMLPAIAAHAIAAYTEPGDVVLDPMCGIGTTLVEAIRAGRDAVGVEYEPPWAQLARRNLHHARSQGATGHGTVHQGDARQISSLLDPELVGRVALVLTSPPYGASLHGQVTARPGTGVAKRDYRYSRDPANLAHVGLDRLLDAMVDILTGCQPFLKPGGIVAMTVRPYWEKGVMVDLPGRLTTAVSDRTGLTLLDRNVALLAALREERLVTRASFFQLAHIRKARANGIPRHLVAHEDLLVFLKPATCSGSEKLKGSQGEPECSPRSLSSSGTWVRADDTGIAA
ncbi:TRM11 family SAM-dependent methyltransferase [Jatrophihabitans lederbergiae]|uniref:Methyltransferase n=1 Tax=Jatrophihabitans lederbergiae TaxID=3075547 RepID=A0ABU2JHC4_9ACTN|nr:DNA methyltransferase [Jatrophihabitans sp. DSM 44399]MDT0264118.1 DNA methyltransferase [Jatrophihabitans sp. DSM 44399]